LALVGLGVGAVLLYAWIDRGADHAGPTRAASASSDSAVASSSIQNPKSKSENAPIPPLKPLNLSSAAAPQAEGFSPGSAGSSHSASSLPNAGSPPSGGSQSPTATSPTPSSQPSPLGGNANADLARGFRLIEDQKLIEGRALLSRLLTGNPRLPIIEEQRIRDILTSVNEALVFSPQVTDGDPLAEKYVVQSGDLLARIAPRYHIPYACIERINRIQARNLQAGKVIKLIKGPFFAVITKHDFRLDLYLTGPDGLPIYVRSLTVGLGEGDSTPTGHWIVEAGRKVQNPDWRNPRTGEYFGRDEPKNPIGEYWMALEGLEGDAAGKTGYGIHGTIEPDSVGRMMSMGCVRLRNDDIALLYDLLADGHSKVYITP
jgi:lipoprotein-anchoring transpeptidase ErfK/SrfK